MSGASARVRAVRFEPLDLELTESFGIATGAQERLANVLVSVELEGGVVGLGEAAPLPAASGETQASTLDALARLARVAEGLDARRLRPLAAALDREAHEAPAARAAVETAALDAAARLFGYPLWHLFGGALEPLESDLTVVTGTVAHAAASAAAFAARGFRALKIKVGALGPREDAERVEAAHRAAPGCALLADANGGWDAAGALAFLDELGRRGLSLSCFEQPVPAGDVAGLARVQAATAVPVVADESARSLADVARLAEARACKGVNVKLQKTGVAEALEIAAFARGAGLDLMIGGMVETALAASVAAHLASGRGGFRWIDLDTPLFVRSHPFEGGARWDGPRVDVSGAGPGHGVTRRG